MGKSKSLAWRCMAVAAQMLAFSAAQAQSVSYSLDLAHTRVYWEVRHFGTSTSRGRFDDIEGQIRMDKAAGSGEVSISVGTASVDSGVGPLDSRLRGGDFFASAEHPRAYFVSRQWKFSASGPSELRGEFTLRGISQPLTLRAQRFNCYMHTRLAREVCGGDFEADLSRSDFGITYGLPFVAEKVRLVIQVEAVRQ